MYICAGRCTVEIKIGCLFLTLSDLYPTDIFDGVS